MHHYGLPAYQKLPTRCHVCGQRRFSSNLKKVGWIADKEGIVCKRCARWLLSPENLKEELRPRKETDLLIGMTSRTPKGLHYFLGDFDRIPSEELMNRVGEILFIKEHFGTVYMIRTGKGFHLGEFTTPITIKRYVRILKEMEADVNFIKWVNKVKYGVLRLSRRSGHWNVPYLEKVLTNPDSTKLEDASRKAGYLMILNLESDISTVDRVEVFE